MHLEVKGRCSSSIAIEIEVVEGCDAKLVNEYRDINGDR